MPMPGPWELTIILVIVVLIFGVGKLGDIGGAVGRTIREFRKESAMPEDDEIKKNDGDEKTVEVKG